MEVKTTNMIVLGKEVHWTTRMERLENRCVYGFAVFGLDLFLHCSVLVDSHACDETSWPEPWEKHRRATPCCLELLVNNPQA